MNLTTNPACTFCLIVFLATKIPTKIPRYLSRPHSNASLSLPPQKYLPGPSRIVSPWRWQWPPAACTPHAACSPKPNHGGRRSVVYDVPHGNIANALANTASAISTFCIYNFFIGSGGHRSESRQLAADSNSSTGDRWRLGGGGRRQR
jgi:hypothetical protein